MNKKSSIIITALIFAIISVFVFHLVYKLGKHYQETYITQDDIEKKEYTVKVVFTDNVVDTLTIKSLQEPFIVARTSRMKESYSLALFADNQIYAKDVKYIKHLNNTCIK